MLSPLPADNSRLEGAGGEMVGRKEEMRVGGRKEEGEIGKGKGRRGTGREKDEEGGESYQ